MILRLASGSVTPASRSRKRSSASTCDERHLVVVAERGDDLLALVLAHHPVVDVHARELVADRLVHEQRRHRRVDPAGQAADHAPVADLLADSGDLLLDHRRRGPGHVAAADALQERLEHCVAVRRVDDLRVVLDAVQAAVDVLQRRHRRLGRRRERGEARRRLEHGVAVRHPARCSWGWPNSSRPSSRTSSCERPNSPTGADSTRPPSSSTIACMP